ncbi:MAG TPA: hypothetical protein VHJ58_15205 [Vicinamibacterales bacterium]|nr:hypothetical protein [Vicinamibacterales bacterium]
MGPRTGFPANVDAARQAFAIGESPAMPLALRSILRIIFLAAVLVAGLGSCWLDTCRS